LFRINFNHHSPEAIVRRSRVTRAATFAGVTKGVAVKYVGRGQELYTVGEERILLDAGEFLLLPAGTAYGANPGAVGQATTGVCIDFLANLPEESGFDFLYGGTFRVADLGLADLANWDTLPDPLAAAQIPNLQQEIKTFLESAVGLGDALHPVANQATTRRELSKSLLTARQYLHRYYAEDIVLADLARVAGLSKYHFARLFKRAFGITPLRMQTSLRMQAAANKIKLDRTSLTAIAQTVGYTDLATFSRHFRAHFGVPPSKWLQVAAL
jgi:AraC-like DNA-binding protein